MNLRAKEDYIQGLLSDFKHKYFLVGDTLDISRNRDNNLFTRKFDIQEYISRNFDIISNAKKIIEGNHDKGVIQNYLQPMLSNEFNIFAGSYHIQDNVLAIHGHQIQTGINTSLEYRYTKQWEKIVNSSVFYLHEEVKEIVFKIYDKFPLFKEDFIKLLVKRMLNFLDNNNLLGNINTIVFGHFHIPFEIKYTFKGTEYTLYNCGCLKTYSNIKPIIINDHLYVSDLHLV